MAENKSCPTCNVPLRGGDRVYVFGDIEGIGAVDKGPSPIKKPARWYNCPQCHLVQLYAEDQR